MDTQLYHNPTDKPIVFSVSIEHREPAKPYTVEPGAELEGPVTYAAFYKRQGLAIGAAPKKAKKKALTYGVGVEAAEAKAEQEEQPQSPNKKRRGS